MSTGKALVEQLTRQLGPHMVWDESELVTLGMIEEATDRLEVLKARFATAATDPDITPSALAALAGECRLSEVAITKWAASLDPQDNTAKSARHVAAANARWHRASGT